jgi:cytidyltransferase-like protein
MKKSTKEIWVAVSGGFDPIHVGHVRLFNRAKQLGDKLVVIMNNDNWLRAKKKFVFMPEKERREVIEALKPVDKVVLSKHEKNPKDMSVSEMLKLIKPDIFANGGDRNEKDAANPNSSLYTDIQTCKRLGIKMIFNIGDGGKVQSSSWLIDKAVKSIPTKIEVKVKSRK